MTQPPSWSHPEEPQPERPFSGQPGPAGPGQPDPGQSYPGQSYPDHPYSGQPYPDQSQSGQPYPDQPYPGQSQPGQPSPGGSYPGRSSPGQPSPGQPSPGQGDTDVTAVFPAPGLLPGYPPGYPADGAQPGYAQTGYLPAEAAQFPGAPAAAPPRKSKLVPIVLTSVAVLLVLCVGGVTTAFYTLKDKADVLSEPGDRPTTGSGKPSNGKTTTAAPKTAAPKTTAPKTTAPKTTTPKTTVPKSAAKLITPARLNGRPKLTDPQFVKLAKSLEKQLGEVPGATQSVGALYGDMAKRNVVIVAAVAAPVSVPEIGLNAALSGMGTSGMTLTGVTTVPAGALGGVAKCGNNTTQGVKLAVCAWADEHVVGWFLWYFKSANQVKKEFPKLRGQVEKVS